MLCCLNLMTPLSFRVFQYVVASWLWDRFRMVAAGQHLGSNRNGDGEIDSIDAVSAAVSLFPSRRNTLRFPLVACRARQMPRGISRHYSSISSSFHQLIKPKSTPSCPSHRHHNSIITLNFVFRTTSFKNGKLSAQLPL